MNTPVLDQKRAYRRGLLLGFTMAEVTIMVLFCLLLASAFLLEKNDEQLKVVQSKIAELSETRNMVEAFRSKYRDSPKIEDIFTELRLVNRENEELKQKTSVQKSALAALAQDAEVGKGVKDALANVGLKEASSEELTAIVKAGLSKGDQAIQCERDAIERKLLQGQLKNAQVTLSRLGKGTEMPACWANPQTGKPEYIFTVDLTSTGLVIHDEKLPHREAERGLLPLSQVTFDVEQSPEAFSSQTRPIFQWGKSQEIQCRFFVKVRDRTQATEKDVYKRMLQTLENHFYKLEINGNG